MAASSLSSYSSWPEELQVREAKLWLLRGKGEGQRAAQGSPWSQEWGWGQAWPLPELQHWVQHEALPGRTGSSSCPELPPSHSQPGSSQIPVGALPALPWMELEQNLSSSTEPVLLDQGFQHLELLGMSRSWTWRCGASLAWLCSTGSTVGQAGVGECHGQQGEGAPRRGHRARVWLPPSGVSAQTKQGLDPVCGHLHTQAAEMQLCLCLCTLSPL